MIYKGLDIKWKVFDYDTDEDQYDANDVRQVTVKIFSDATEAATFCVDHHHAGVEMIAFPAKSEGVKV